MVRRKILPPSNQCQVRARYLPQGLNWIIS
jgi:hypothetical protein